MHFYRHQPFLPESFRLGEVEHNHIYICIFLIKIVFILDSYHHSVARNGFIPIYDDMVTTCLMDLEEDGTCHVPSCAPCRSSGAHTRTAHMKPRMSLMPWR